MGAGNKMLKTKEIPCNFVGDFKVGDNLVFNAQMLCALMVANERGAFNKLIVIQIGSIVEAALAQIIYRAQHYNREGVPNLSEDYRTEIERKTIENFSVIVDVLKKYSALDPLGEDIYTDLHNLRKYRNKIHIQEDIEIEDVSRDDVIAFSDEIRNWALDLNVGVLTFLSEHLPRPKHLHNYVNPLLVPCQSVKAQARNKSAPIFRVVRYAYSQDGKSAKREVLAEHLRTRDAAVAYINAQIARNVADVIDKDEGRWWITYKSSRATWLLIDETSS